MSPRMQELQKKYPTLYTSLQQSLTMGIDNSFEKSLLNNPPPQADPVEVQERLELIKLFETYFTPEEA